GLAWLGVGWLSYLAWSLFRSAGGIDGAEPPRRLGVLGGAALQLVNPKAWMMALAALALFAGEGAGQAGRIGLLALLFFLVSLPCLASWALLGVGSARLLRSPSLMKRFNQGMALLLLASAWAALLL
ncbi:LysE family translocator, partial [Pseudomonas aeruginosa]|nr:LysE family translocator [Pseudomonas aeruginosa]